jgi:hypothetical protein
MYNTSLSSEKILLNILYLCKIAINEPQQSAEMTRLKAEGYKTFADIPPSLLLNSGSEDQKRGSAIDDLTVLYTEVSLMLQADVFLTWDQRNRRYRGG